MANLGTLTFAANGAEHATASMASLVATLEALPEVAELLLQGSFRSLVLGDNVSDLIVIKPVDAPTSGAGVLECVQILPSDRYLEFVAAIVSDRENEISSEIRHGWPILSVGVVAVPTVADAGGVASLSGESPALCATCDARLDDTSIRACSVRACPHAQKDAA
ncbi:MAG: hypothetical protein ABIV36_22565 [Sphingobium limneticum]